MMGWTGFEILILVLATLMVPVGCCLILLAIRRRRGVGRYCPTCDYSLKGLPAGVSRCPECGTDLAGVQSVRIGRRSTDRILAIAGFAMFAPIIAIAPHFVSKFGQPPMRTLTARVTLMPPRPAMPVPQPGPYASMTDDGLADAILSIETSSVEREPLLKEALNRAKTLGRNQHRSVQEDDWLNRLVKYGLAMHDDESKPWPEPWARLIESLPGTVYLDRDTWRHYLQTGVKVEVDFQDSIAIGTVFPLQYRVKTRMGFDLSGQIKLRMLTLSLGDASTDDVLRTEPKSVGSFSTLGTMNFTFTDEQWRRVSPGPATARLTMLAAFSPRTPVASDWIIRIDKSITVTPRHQYQNHYTPGLDESVARSLSIAKDFNDHSQGGLKLTGDSALLVVGCLIAPCDLFVQIRIRSEGHDGQEHWYDVGTAHWQKGESSLRGFNVDLRKPRFEGKDVTITFSGSPQSAESSFAAGDWWQGDARFDHVTVTGDTTATAAVPDVLVKRRKDSKIEPYDGFFPLDDPTTRPADVK